MKKEDDVDDIVLQTQNILKKIQEQMRLTEEVLSLSKPTFEEVNVPSYAKSMIIPQKRQPKNIFKIRESVQEFVNLDQIIEKKPEKSPFDESCSICNSKIYFNKYICIVCDCVLCPKCEINHEHPVLKCKFSQLSSLESIYIYINTKNPEVKNSRNNSSFFLSNIFANKYELKMECNSNSFTMRPNSKKNIPITLYNLSTTDLDCEKNKVSIYGKDNKDLRVDITDVKNKMNKNEKVEILVTIESNNDNKKNYNFELEIYSSILDNKLKSNILIFKVEINDDQEDEELNQFFKDYPSITIESLDIKKGVKKIYEDTKNKHDPITILKYLKKNNGNVDDTFYQLNYSNTNKAHTVN